MIIGFVTLFLSVLYSAFILWCLYYWNSLPDKSSAELTNKNIKVAVIIPARNEAGNIPDLLRFLKLQDYPFENFSIIISDDHSTDDTLNISGNVMRDENIINGKCLKSPGHSKKSALAFAVENTNAELIITTDADTRMQKNWISSVVHEFVTSGAYLICGPVKITGGKNYFEKLQSIEFAGLSGITAAGILSGKPMMCNGANLAFSKKIFQEVKGYDDSRSSSGDDTQLMLKIHQRYPGKISYLKNTSAIVETSVHGDIAGLWQQRRRWASKIPFTLSPFTISIAALAWLFHAFLLIQILNTIIHGHVLFLFLPWITKIISEIFLLKTTGKFYHIKIPLWLIICAQPFYCLYIVMTGLIAPFGAYHWKGRKVR